MPFLDAPPIPPKKARGIEITRAQGQEMIRKVRALYIHTFQAPRPISGGTIAQIKASPHTIGVYT